MWALVALAGTTCFAGVNLIDKHILDRRLPSVVSFYAWLVLMQVVYVAIILGVTGIPWDAPADKLLIAFLSGLSIGAGLAFKFFGLKLEEASRAVAIAEVYPVYVALLAVAFLGEFLDPVQWVAVLLVVLGGILVSFRGGTGRSLPRRSRGLPFLLAAGIGQGVGFFAAKFALQDLSLWTVFVFQLLGSLVVFIFFAHPRAWRDLFSVLRNKRFLLFMVAGEGVLPFIALILSLWAISLGPVSLVVALLAIRPMFVFAGSSVLSKRRWRVMEESLAPSELAYKALSIAMIVAGASTLGFY